MTDNLFTTTSEASARLVNVIGQKNVPGYVLIRKWPYIDAKVADTLVVALEAVTNYSSPQADSQVYAGTFANSEVRSEASTEDNDRQVTITQTLTLLADISDNTDAEDDLPEPRAIYRDENINPLTFSDWELPRQYLRLIYSNINPADHANVIDKDNISEADWEAQAAAKVNSAESESPETSAWEYRKLESKFEDNGTLTITVEFDDPDFDEDTDETAKETIALVNEGGWGETEVERIKGKDIENAAGTIAALSADTDRVITNKSWNEGQPGEAIIDKQQKIGKDYGATAGTASAPLLIMDQEATATLPKTIVATWFRVKAGSVAAVVADAEADANWETYFGSGTTTVNGFVYKKTDYRQNPDGTVDVTSTVWVPRTKSYAAPSTGDTYVIYRTELEKAGTNPEPSTLDPNPADGHWWRAVIIEISVKWTASDTSAFDFAQDGLFESYSKFVPSVGLFYAEKITDRIYGDWKDTAKDAETAVLGALNSGLAFKET